MPLIIAIGTSPEAQHPLTAGQLPPDPVGFVGSILTEDGLFHIVTEDENFYLQQENTI